MSITMSGRKLWKRLGVPSLAVVVPLTLAVLGAIATGPSTGVVGGVESLSSASSRVLVNVVELLPLGFAFGAGMVSTVNPCGFAMLPAYLGLYIGSNENAETHSSAPRRLARALLVSGSVTAGFILLFGVAGIIIGGGARSVVGIIPWVGLGTGALLAVAGAWLVAGGQWYSDLAVRASTHMGDPTRVSVRSYFVFGLSYGTASLGCTLPIFLTVVGTSLTAKGFLGSLGQFFIYALGMGLIITTLTLAMALFKHAVVGTLHRAQPYMQLVSAGLMILAGAYIVFYWLTIGGLLQQLA